MSPELELILIAVLAAVACAVVGGFLVVRGLAMTSDAISHAVLPGIAIGFFATQNLSSPWLVAGAALAGLAAVWAIEAVLASRLLRQDAAIGVVFPMFFALGVILISLYASGVHLDTDAVLLGELAFAPFDRLMVAGHDLGPRALWLLGGVTLLNLTVVGLLFKELRLAAFDRTLAAGMGFSPLLLHYLLMALVSLTAVAAFQAVGSVLVVALMVTPPATAYLLTSRLAPLLGLAAVIGSLGALGGYGVAQSFDLTIAGAMAFVLGLIFALVALLSPKGILAHRRGRKPVGKV
jgi:manganese/zinc/iron transport system permease protein